MVETKIKEIWETYRACWSEANTAGRENKLNQIIAEDFEFYDPNIDLDGSQKLSDYMAQFQKDFPDCTFTITDFMIHHDRSLAHWDMVNSDKEVVGNGSDFAFYSDGKLKAVSSFFKES
ncbi:nuclear transport factor 2 family protein [Belliella marina]|uniref:Nuclear transport factor 2 family protein n=1 Tax=Belliella marina TaxID=1644146 RepID=A0ABW4VFZ4_9BACT